MKKLLGAFQVLISERRTILENYGNRRILGRSLRTVTRDRVLVAAVCYRLREDEPEFLLVRTRSGRWTFPKGGVDDDPTSADAAAREAYEEAGVVGSVEAMPFACYVHSKGGVRERREMLVDAHLCEVGELVKPEESYRDPTWFSAEKAKRRLRENRTPKYASELLRVVETASECIRRRKR